MIQYTIYCTPEQTRQAFELGAPIDIFGYGDLGDAEDKILKLNNQCIIEREDDNSVTVSFLPTAEQMLNWLEEQGVKCFVLQDMYDDNTYNIQINKELIRTGHSQYNYPLTHNSRKEATLSAIDAALEYLISNK